MLRIDALTHSYRNSSEATLRGISMQLHRGKIACLLGASGCGKTTLLRCIAGFEGVTGGEITLNGEVIASAQHWVPPEKRRIGVVFQDYALFPHLSVRDNVAFGIRSMKADARRYKVDSLLRSVDLFDFADRYPAELSGGQRQRVALARALAPEPELLLLDEPFSNLDPRLRERMKHELQQLLRNFGVTAVLVTHNQDEAFDIADEIGVMAGGRILQWGTAYELYHKPRSKKVAEFLGMSTFLPAQVSDDGCLHSELGELVCKEDLKTMAGKKVLVLLRPDDIVHDDQAEPLATLERIAFRGMYQIYYLRLPSGSEIQCFTSSHHHGHEIGCKMGIRLDMQHAVILHDEEELTVEQVDELPQQGRINLPKKRP